MTLTADVRVRRNDFTLEVSVAVADGETLALLGPNGAGKSTLLAAIAGLLTPETGTIEVNGRMLTSAGAGAGASASASAGAGASGVAGIDAVAPANPAGSAGASRTRRRVSVAPHERGVGLLGQDPLLFPHLSARENVAFGARAGGVPAGRARTEADSWLRGVGLAGLADRRPTQLSGGQQQKVAIGRALAAKPQVLLLDEPMAALDVQNAASVRTLLREHLRAAAIPTIVVTHDVVDALVLADRVAIVDDGRIVDIGDPAVVLGQPLNEFAAKLVGLNIVTGTLGGDKAVRCGDGRRIRAGAGKVVASDVVTGDTVTAAFPPSAVRIAAERTNSTDDRAGESVGERVGERVGEQRDHHGHTWGATVGALEPAVAGIRVPFVGESFTAELTTADALASGLREGMRVSVTIDPEFVTVYRSRSVLAEMGG